MSTERSKTDTIPTDPFETGAYLTDGNALFNVVGELPHEPSLRLIEDCRTLEILMVHVDGLNASHVRKVQPLGAATRERARTRAASTPKRASGKRAGVGR